MEIGKEKRAGEQRPDVRVIPARRPEKVEAPRGPEKVTAPDREKVPA